MKGIILAGGSGNYLYDDGHERTLLYVALKDRN
jgi:hypothetical protein